MADGTRRVPATVTAAIVVKRLAQFQEKSVGIFEAKEDKREGERKRAASPFVVFCRHGGRTKLVVPLRGTMGVLAWESVGCAALHPRLFEGDRYAVEESTRSRSPWVALRFTHGYSKVTATRSRSVAG